MVTLENMQSFTKRLDNEHNITRDTFSKSGMSNQIDNKSNLNYFGFDNENDSSADMMFNFTDGAKSTRNLSIRNIHKVNSKTDRKFDANSITDRNVRICNKNRNFLVKRKEVKKEYDEILEKLQKQNLQEENSNFSEVNPEEAFDEIGYKKLEEKTLTSRISKLALTKLKNKKQTSKK